MKDVKPIISVVTVCYNAEDLIDQVINSVLSQTFENFEYIIKDGASTDKTFQIAKSYEDKFEARGIVYKCISAKDNGIYDAMNKSVEFCEGTFIHFLNADDRYFDENVLKRVFDNNNWEFSDILYGDTLEIEFGEYYYYMKDLGVIGRRMPFSHQSTFAKKDALLRFPFDLKYRIGGDYNFLLTCYQAGLTFSDVNTVISVVAKEGVSSVGLYESFMEATAIQKEHGIENYSEKKLKWKIRYATIKQFGMSYFPNWLKYAIRKYQRMVRKQPMVDITKINKD